MFLGATSLLILIWMGNGGYSAKNPYKLPPSDGGTDVHSDGSLSNGKDGNAALDASPGLVYPDGATEADNLGMTAGDVPPIPILLDAGPGIDISIPFEEDGGAMLPAPDATLVEGEVYDVLGSPVPGAKVWVNNKPERAIQTGESGRFRIWVEHPGLVSFVAEHPTGGMDTSPPTRIFAKEPRRGIIIRLPNRLVP